jgi:UDP:flavonoid glycosyltransferase YjiC (YdhE family)
MRVLFTSIRNIGHFQPLVPLIEGCLAEGHETLVSAPPDLAERVAKTGAEFLPFGHPGDEGLRPLWQAMRDLPENQRGSFVMGKIFAGACVRAALPALLTYVETRKPEVIVREAQEYAGLLVGERWGVPTVRVGISLEMPHLTLHDVVPALAEHRRGLGLTADEGGHLLDAERIITQFPPSLWPHTDSAQLFRFRASSPVAKAPLPAAVPPAWSGSGRPLVYATLGTVAGGMNELHTAYRLVLDALATLPVQALLTTGDALDPASLGTIPDNVVALRFVPQAELLGHVRAVLCHGGSGTVLGTLAAGVPMVVLPLFADQPTNAAEVAKVGAGLSVPYAGATSDALAQALTRVLGESSFSDRARALAAEMAALPHVSEVPAWLSQVKA